MFKELLGEAFPIIEKTAPIMASVLGSPIAGTATLWGLDLLSAAFGINPSDPAKLKEAVLQNPNSYNMLNTLEGYFKSNFPQLKAPSKAEINLKIEWDTLS